MSTPATPAPRVARIEVHYDDGSKDEFTPAPKEGTRIPLYLWRRAASESKFDRAYDVPFVAAALFQTALARQLMPPPSLADRDTVRLQSKFAPIWLDEH